MFDRVLDTPLGFINGYYLSFTFQFNIFKKWGFGRIKTPSSWSEVNVGLNSVVKSKKDWNHSLFIAENWLHLYLNLCTLLMIMVCYVSGMALIINEAKEHHVSPPQGFPICSDFNHDPSIDVSYIRAGKKFQLN